MAPRKKAAKTEEPKTGTQLVDALRFIKLAQNNVTNVAFNHCVLYGQWAYGFDGVLSAGHAIQEDMALAPLTQRLIDALERCEEQMAIVALPSGLSVKSGRFKAVVPCFPLQDMPAITPDPPIAVIDDRLRAAFAAVGPLATEGAQRVIMAAVRLSAMTAQATNGHVCMEYWHGIDLPTVLLPKQAVKAIEAVNKPLARFGFSSGSATFYFDDGSWIKTQLYQEKYPIFDRVLNVESNPWPITPGLFDALRKLKPFVDDLGAVIFEQNLLRTSRVDNAAGGTYECVGIPEGPVFNLNYLMLLEKLAKTVDYGNGERANLIFFGDNVRGAIAGMRV